MDLMKIGHMHYISQMRVKREKKNRELNSSNYFSLLTQLHSKMVLKQNGYGELPVTGAKEP